MAAPGGRALLLHVVSVFEHAGRVRVVTAFFGIHKQRWHYEVIRDLDAESLWLDGEDPPHQWQRDGLAARHR